MPDERKVAACPAVGQRKLRQIEFSRRPERACIRDRCLGVAHEGPAPIRRSTN